MNMHHLAARFLTASEQEGIQNAVREAEKSTAAEIVPLVVGASHDYPKAETLGSMVYALIFGAILTELFGARHMWIFLACFCLLFFGFHELLKRFPALKRPFLSKERMEDEVSEGALTAFFRHGLFGTRDRTGILIYISVFERKVWILADSGITEVVPQSTLNGITAELTAGIKAGRQAEAITAAVRKCASIVAPHFPREADDADELANLIIEQ